MIARSCAASLVGVACLTAVANRLHAQAGGDRDRPRWQGELGVAAINSAIGGVTAAAFTAARRVGRAAPGEARPGWRAIRRAFAVGAGGGAVVYAGKRVAGQGFDASGLLGRQLASVGAAVVRNAGDGRSPLAAIVLPLGPVRLYGGREPGDTSETGGAARPRWAWRAKLDVGTVVGALVAASEPGARLDPGRSLSAGTPVLVSSQRRLIEACYRGDQRACVDMTGPERQGFAAAGAIWLFERAHPLEGMTTMRALQGHEQVHVVQYDAGLTQWSLPAERWLLARVPGGAWVHRHADLGISALVAGWIGDAIPYESRPWEREAYFLSHTDSDGYTAPGLAPDGSPERVTRAIARRALDAPGSRP